MKKFMTLFFLSAIAFVGVSCSDDDESEGDSTTGGASTSELTQVTVTPDRTRILVNPLSGWVLYTGIGDGLKDNFWEIYDEFPCADAPDGSGYVNVSDYANVLYIKAAWSAMNPEDGVYIWEQDESYSEPARRLKLLVDGAKERGMKIAFTINTNSVDKHENYTPDFVREAGAEGYWTTTGSATVFSGYPDDPVFQQYYEKFVNAFAAKYNDPDEVAFISGIGLGAWGECHTFKYSTGDATPREDVLTWAWNLYANAFTQVPVVQNYHRWVGCTNGADGSNYDPDSEALLDKAIEIGFSMRHDAFGMKSYYMTWEKSFITARKYTVPVLAEGGWVKTSHGSSINGDGYADYAEVRQGEYEDAAASYVNMMDFRYNSDTYNSETWSWFNEAFDLVEQFFQEGCYRLYPNQLYLPETVSTGSTVSVRSRWANLGWSYCPTNIKQWAGRYYIAYALLDPETLEPEYIFKDADAAINNIVKNSMQTFTFSMDMSGVAAGDYVWGIGIVNAQNDDEIGIELSAREDDLTDEGWLKLISVTVK